MTALHPISALTQSQLVDQGLDPKQVSAVIERALAEDVSEVGDVTTLATVTASQRSHARYVVRSHGTIAGVCVLRAVLELVIGSDDLNFRERVTDGAQVNEGDVVADVEAPTRLLLTAERTSLNLLGHLSGIATLTAQWVEQVAGTETVIRDTRKTTPGLRTLEKFAVRCGGAQNHRMNLSDAALIKDNHVAAAGSVAAAVQLVRRHDAVITVEVEVDTLDQLEEALDAGADLILLDNMNIDTTKKAVDIVALRRSSHGHAVILEASGGLTLANARAVALTGVNFLAVGALTHSAPTLDIGLDMDL